MRCAALIRRFVRQHGTRSGWIDERRLLFRRGPPHGIHGLPAWRRQKLGFRLPHGFHFDVAHERRRNFRLSDKKGARASSRATRMWIPTGSCGVGLRERTLTGVGDPSATCTTPTRKPTRPKASRPGAASRLDRRRPQSPTAPTCRRANRATTKLDRAAASQLGHRCPLHAQLVAPAPHRLRCSQSGPCGPDPARPCFKPFQTPGQGRGARTRATSLPPPPRRTGCARSPPPPP